MSSYNPFFSEVLEDDQNGVTLIKTKSKEIQGWIHSP